MVRLLILIISMRIGEVGRNMVVAKPGTLKTYKRFEAEIYVLTKDEGGRHTAFFLNYMPQFYMRTADITGKVELPENVKMVMPGDNVTAVFELLSAVPLEAGLYINTKQKDESTRLLELRLRNGTCLPEPTTLHFPSFGLLGQRFALREGGRTIGAGVVSKILG